MLDGTQCVVDIEHKTQVSNAAWEKRMRTDRAWGPIELHFPIGNFEDHSNFTIRDYVFCCGENSMFSWNRCNYRRGCPGGMFLFLCLQPHDTWGCLFLCNDPAMTQLTILNFSSVFTSSSCLMCCSPCAVCTTHQPCNWCDNHLSKSHDLHVGILTWIWRMTIWKKYNSAQKWLCWDIFILGIYTSQNICNKMYGMFWQTMCTIQNTRSLLGHVVRLELRCIFAFALSTCETTCWFL